jgi:hypothetical protein
MTRRQLEPEGPPSVSEAHQRDARAWLENFCEVTPGWRYNGVSRALFHGKQSISFYFSGPDDDPHIQWFAQGRPVDRCRYGLDTPAQALAFVLANPEPAPAPDEVDGDE